MDKDLALDQFWCFQWMLACIQRGVDPVSVGLLLEGACRGEIPILSVPQQNALLSLIGDPDEIGKHVWKILRPDGDVIHPTDVWKDEKMREFGEKWIGSNIWFQRFAKGKNN